MRFANEAHFWLDSEKVLRNLNNQVNDYNLKETSWKKLLKYAETDLQNQIRIETSTIAL